MTGTITTDRTLKPYLYYEDAAAAIDWLTDAFGFTERFRLDAPGGIVLHAELGFKDGVIMLGNVGPRNAVRPEQVRSGVYVYVDDVDAHHERARRAGADIVEPPSDQPFGDRIYLVLDHEGHEWYFAQHIRDVSLDELRKTVNR